MKEWIKIALIVVIFLGILKQPYEYYEFLRVFVFVASVYLTIEKFRKQMKNGYGYGYLSIAVLFNPITPINFTRDTWILIDMLVLVSLAISLGADKGDSSNQ
ncbi:hypothetical protein J45TS6_45630 [Paenibacillus sp. J45TS6]|uniref:DUF6804 family protein n=1 Tax=unclassified Paenibacillus TaxID=185978 RepID=UPI00191F07C3|nr:MULTISPECIES: DUF6804 family protein [unclassified Paenibacillus]GIP46104.1 hypothetical protein J45TS6_45630 [Paenibacillus sp. J45TS6]